MLNFDTSINSNFSDILISLYLKITYKIKNNNVFNKKSWRSLTWKYEYKLKPFAHQSRLHNIAIHRRTWHV